MTPLLQWLDFLWLPLAFLTVRTDQKLWVFAFFLSNMLMMRLAVELIESTGYTFGFLGLTHYSVQSRALAVYNGIYLIYLAIALFSPYARGIILIGTSVSLFFMALFLSLFLMVL